MRSSFGGFLALALGLAGCSEAPSDAGGDTTGGAGGGSGVTAGAAGAFPNDGREYKTIVNIVDADAVAAIEAVLEDPSGEHDYALAAQAFYALYPDEYDFLYFVLDHGLAEDAAFATFAAVNRPVMPGTGIEIAQAAAAYGSHGRLKGAVGTQASMDGAMPPFAHETLHYWGNHFDPALGFGQDLDQDYGAHWGQAGVFGQLGGFDPATLRCANPAGAMPTGCIAESNGRFVYRAGIYAPSSNAFQGVVYAPLELYLMGLVPLGEVRTSFPLLEEASVLEIDPASGTTLVEARGVGQIETSAIVDRHGTREPAPEADRHFTAAFVVVTRAPASSVMLDQVVVWQEIFGNHAPPIGFWISFEEHSGGRATLSTRIGRRRTADDP